MRKGVTWFHRFIGDLVLGWLFSILYVSGLTLVFPFIYFLKLPGITSPGLLGAAAVLIFVSVLGFLWIEGTFAKTLKALSKITLIPGVIGAVFGLLGPHLAFGVLRQTAYTPESIDLLVKLIEQAAPKVLSLTVAYVVLGIILWWIGDQLEK